MATEFTYSISSDFPGGAVNTTRLQTEIGDSSIAPNVVRIDTLGDSITIFFDANLSAGEETTLDGDTTGPAGGLIAAHDNSQTEADPGTPSRGDIVQFNNPGAEWVAPTAATGVVGVPTGATVAGSNATYSTLSAAVAAGETVIHVVGNTTEAADTVVQAGGFTAYFYDGAQVNMGGQTFDFGALQDQTLKFFGDGRIRFSYSSSFDELFDDAGSTNKVVIDGVDIINQSTTFGPDIHGGDIDFRNMLIEVPSQSSTLFGFNAGVASDVSLNNVTISGGGPGCGGLIDNSNAINLRMQDVFLVGEFSTGFDIWQLNCESAVVNNVLFDLTDSNGARIDFGPSAVSNVVAIGQDIDVETGGGRLSNVNVDDGELSMGASNSVAMGVKAATLSISNFVNELVFSDCQLGDGTTTVIVNNSDNNQFDNCVLDFTQFTVGNNSEGFIFSNCRFKGNLTLNGDSNRFVNCQIDGIIDLNSGASGNVFIGCTRSSVTDDGTDTVFIDSEGTGGAASGISAEDPGNPPRNL